jgi:hypothetical protein
MGGSNEPRNILKVNIPLHALLHKLLWEECGRWQDNVAYRMLSGQITAAEATIEAIKKAQTGRKHSAEHNEKKRQARLGTKLSEQTKRKISESNKGRHIISEKQKKILSETHRGKNLSKEHKNILSLTHKGIPKSESQKEKMSKSAILSWTPDRIEKARKTHTGKKLSESTKEKLRQSRLGSKLSEEHKKKINESLKKRWSERGELVSR